MKVLLVIILSVCIVVAIGIGVFLMTFDLDKYRPVIEKKISDATGAKAEIKRLALAWQNGIALKAYGISLNAATAQGERPVLTVASASAVLKLAPLIRKSVEVGSVIIDNPFILIEKDTAGNISVCGMRPPAPAPAGAPAAAAPAPVAVSVDLIEIKNGTLEYRDYAPNAPVALAIRKADIRVSNIQPSAPVSFNARLAVLSASQNVDASGSLMPPGPNEKGYLKDLKVSIDLALLDMAEAVKALPALAQAGINAQPKGRVDIEAARLGFDPAELARADCLVKVRAVTISTSKLPAPLESIDGDLRLANGNLDIKGLRAGFADGMLDIEATVQDIAVAMRSSFKLSATRLSIDRLAPRVGQAEPYMTGRFSIDFEGTSSGGSYDAISKTLSGAGHVKADGLKIGNFNVIRKVFEQLSVLPGAVEALESRLPADYKPKITAADTSLEPVNLAFSVKDGTVTIQDFMVKTDHFSLGGQCSIGLDLSLGGVVLLQMSPELSLSFMKSINDLKYMMNSREQIEIPIKLKGTIPQVRVVPDLQYVAQKFAASKTQEVVSDLMSKALKGKEGAQAGQPSTGGEAAPAQNAQTMVMNALQNALNKK